MTPTSKQAGDGQDEGRSGNVQGGFESKDTKSVTPWRKRPVVVWVMLLDETNVHEVCQWSGATPVAYKNERNPQGKRGVAGIEIQTLEGNMLGEFGDYIIRGVQGEFYPCKPEIFLKTYEEVS